MTARPDATAGGGLSRYEDELRQTVTEAAEALFQNDFDSFYAYFSPDYQQRCPPEDMKRMIAVGLQLLGDFRGAKLEITHVEFQADRAFVEAYTDIRGRRVPFFAESRYPTYWVMVDGTWRMTDDNPAPCELFPPTPTLPP